MSPIPGAPVDPVIPPVVSVFPINPVVPPPPVIPVRPTPRPPIIKMKFSFRPAVRFTGFSPVVGQFFQSSLDTKHIPWQGIPLGKSCSLQLDATLSVASLGIRVSIEPFITQPTIGAVDMAEVAHLTGSGNRVFNLKGQKAGRALLVARDAFNTIVASVVIRVLPPRTFTVAFFRGHFIGSGRASRDFNETTSILEKVNAIWKPANITFTEAAVVGSRDVQIGDNAPSSRSNVENGQKSLAVLRDLQRRAAGANRFVVFTPSIFTLGDNFKNEAITLAVIYAKDSIRPSENKFAHELGHSMGLGHFAHVNDGNLDVPGNLELAQNLMNDTGFSDSGTTQTTLTPHQISKANLQNFDWFSIPPDEQQIYDDDIRDNPSP